MRISEIFENLRKYRRAQGLTQSELGKILSLPQGYISQLESGKHDIKVSTLNDWVRVLGMELLLVPQADVQQISYLLTTKSNSKRTVPPAYGALPEGVE